MVLIIFGYSFQFNQEQKVCGMDATKIISCAIIFYLSFHSTDAGTTTYGACQAGCVTITVTCYAAAGIEFDTMAAGNAAPAVIGDCNTAHGTCQSACWTALVLSTP